MNGPKKSLLIVDNDEDWLSLLEKILTSEGFMVYTAQKGGEALTLARTRKPDCLVVDLHLGGEDGLRLCCSIKATPELKGVPVIILSGADAPEPGSGGYDAFVCKALGVGPLLAVIKKLTAQSFN